MERDRIAREGKTAHDPSASPQYQNETHANASTGTPRGGGHDAIHPCPEPQHIKQKHTHAYPRTRARLPLKHDQKDQVDDGQYSHVDQAAPRDLQVQGRVRLVVHEAEEL